MQNLVFEFISFKTFGQKYFVFFKILQTNKFFVQSLQRCIILEKSQFVIQIGGYVLCIVEFVFVFFLLRNHFSLRIGCFLSSKYFFEEKVIVRKRADEGIINKEQIKEEIVANNGFSAVPDFLKEQSESKQLLLLFPLNICFFLLTDLDHNKLNDLIFFDNVLIDLFFNNIKFRMLLKILFDDFFRKSIT